MTIYDIISLFAIISFFVSYYTDLFKKEVSFTIKVIGLILAFLWSGLVIFPLPMFNAMSAENYIKETIEIKTIVKMNDAEVRENKNKAFVFYKDGRMEIRDVNEVESVKFGQKICRFYGLFGLFKSEQEISPRKLIKTPEKE